MRVVLIALAIAIPGMVKAGDLTPTQQSVANELPTYGFKDVDVKSLSTGQLSHIHVLLFSKKSPAQIRGHIGAILGDSLWKTLFK